MIEEIIFRVIIPTTNSQIEGQVESKWAQLVFLKCNKKKSEHRIVENRY